MTSNNYSDGMLRIRAYLRSASDAAASGDFEASLIAIDLIGAIIEREVKPALKAEAKRRRALEGAA